MAKVRRARRACRPATTNMTSSRAATRAPTTNSIPFSTSNVVVDSDAVAIRIQAGDAVAEDRGGWSPEAG